MLRALSFFTLSACLTAAPAGAQDDGQKLGLREYQAACVACHGESGRGDGPIAELMTVEVPDLTTIAARNDGTYPMAMMLEVIDGRTGIRGHGYPMPVFGKRFQPEEGADAAVAELTVRGRVLSLAYYLETIQQ